MRSTSLRCEAETRRTSTIAPFLDSVGTEIAGLPPSTNARKLLRSAIHRIASVYTQYSDKVYCHKARSSNPSRCRIRSACEIGFQSRQEMDMCGNHQGCTFVGSKHDHDQNISTQPRTHDFSLHEHFRARLICATQAGFPRCRRYRPLRSRLAGPGYPVAREARA